MVKKFVVYRSELQEVGSFLPDRDAYDRVVKYEDYELMVADRDYWYEKCLNAGVLDRGDMAHDRKEPDELLDEWYRTEECPYDKR